LATTTAINNLLAATTLNGTAFCQVERTHRLPERSYAPEGVAEAGENRHKKSLKKISEEKTEKKINKITAAATQILRNWGQRTKKKQNGKLPWAVSPTLLSWSIRFCITYL